jgi:hypothetical protein
MKEEAYSPSPFIGELDSPLIQLSYEGTMFIKPTIIAVVLLSVLLPTGRLDAVVIMNEVHSEAHTGGNSADSGTVIEGEARAESSIRTVINGEEVVSEERVETSEGGSAEVHQEVHIEVSEDEATVKTFSNPSPTLPTLHQDSEPTTVEHDESDTVTGTVSTSASPIVDDSASTLVSFASSWAPFAAFFSQLHTLLAVNILLTFL